MGIKYGDLVATIPFTRKGHMYWKCKCRCGKEKDIRDAHLKSGASTSCGYCNYHIDHPLAHKSWDSMNQRCNNPNAPDYKYYGGRGIKVTLHWLRFIDFLDDMGDPPICSITGSRYTLDRIDVNGDYSKENCKWSSIAEQNRNRTNTLPEGIKRYSSGNRRN